MASFCRHFSSRRKSRKNMGLLLNGAGNLKRMNMEKAEVLKPFFILVFIGKTCPHQSDVPESGGKVQSKEDVLLVEEGQVQEHLQKLDMHKSMVADRMYSLLLREVASVAYLGKVMRTERDSCSLRECKCPSCLQVEQEGRSGEIQAC